MRRQKPATTAALLAIPSGMQQVQDPRDLLLSFQKRGREEQAAGSGDGKAAAAVSTESASALQKGPIAFSVALPNTAASDNAHAADGGAAIAPADKASHGQKNSAGSKQHSDTSDSEDAGPSAKAAGLASVPKEQAFAPALNATTASASVVTGMQSQHAPYSDAHLGRTAQSPSTAEVVKTADLPPTPVSRPPQSIDLKVAGADNSQVDVRISQRAGDVQVTVRTPDSDLAQSLRQHLPELSDRLAQSGVNSDIWHPATAQASADTAGNQESWNSDQSQAQQQHSQRNPNGRSNQPREENGGSSNWRNEFNNAEKEER